MYDILTEGLIFIILKKQYTYFKFYGSLQFKN
jgi:hypothetical protein